MSCPPLRDIADYLANGEIEPRDINYNAWIEIGLAVEAALEADVDYMDIGGDPGDEGDSGDDEEEDAEAETRDEEEEEDSGSGTKKTKTPRMMAVTRATAGRTAPGNHHPRTSPRSASKRSNHKNFRTPVLFVTYR